MSRSPWLVIAFSIFLLFSLSSMASAQSTRGLFQQNNDPIIGNPQGKVTIAEFFDYQCSYCVAMASVLHKTVDNNPVVRIVVKQYPIKGRISEIAARAALAANKQGQFNRLNQALMAHSHQLSEAMIMQLARNVGLNMQRLQRDMYSSATTRQLQMNRTLAKSIGIAVTPSFVIGKTSMQHLTQENVFIGSLSQYELQKIIRQFEQA